MKYNNIFKVKNHLNTMCSNYWTASDDIMREHGGRGPPCPSCGKTMHPADDHGRFFCGCGYENEALKELDRLSQALFPNLSKQLRESLDRPLTTEEKEDFDILMSGDYIMGEDGRPKRPPEQTESND